MYSASDIDIKFESVKTSYKKSLEYLDNNKEIVNEIKKQEHIFDIIQELINGDATKFMTGHNFPFNEAAYELANSLQLCLEGFYRYSLLVLRNVIELSVLYLYLDLFHKDINDFPDLESWFNRNRENVEFKSWLHAKTDTPFFKRKMLKKLKELDNYKLYEENFNLFEDLIEIYDLLSNFTHIKGAFHSTYKFESRSSCNFFRFNEFSETNFIFYWNLRTRIMRNIVIFYLLRYPIGMQGLPIEEKFGINGPIGFLQENETDILTSILNSEEKAFLQQLSDNDDWVKGAKEWVLSHPDITDEEFRQQLEDWNVSLKYNSSKTPS